MKVFVPCDMAALSVGADAVARAIAEQVASRRLDVTIVRNGSRGMFWLEPLVEVETSAPLSVRLRTRSCLPRLNTSMH